MKALLLTLLLAGTLGSATAQTPPALADSAQAAYARGDHRRALQFYDSLNGAWSSASLLFNIGNCHFKLNDVPRAILYYERALRLAPGAEDIQANLDLARMQAVDRVNELPAFTLEQPALPLVAQLQPEAVEFTAHGGAVTGQTQRVAFRAWQAL